MVLKMVLVVIMQFLYCLYCNVYADLFINNIISKKNGCYLNRCCVACIMYADDLMLLSASVYGLQQLLDVCALTAKDLCLQFSDKKSHCIIVGPKHKCQPSSVSLSGKPLQWVDSVKYLGITFMSTKIFSVDPVSYTHRRCRRRG